jgi:uncharacterized membrane protein YgaE (UPF0421/DUF939 family)
MSDPAVERASLVAQTRRWTHHRMVGVTLKTALAAGVAWQLGVMLPAYLPSYSFYAPLGALTVMYSSLYDSAVQGLRTLAAVSVGVLVAVGLHLVAGPNAVTVAIALGVGIVLGNFRKLGDQGSWAPMAALFVFTAGRADTLEYVVGYLSQLALGAVVGFTVNSAVFPPLPLQDVERATRAVRRGVVDVLSALVDLLEADRDVVDERADQVSRVLAPLPATRQGLWEATSQAERAQYGNPRRKRWQGTQAAVMALARSTDSTASVMEDLAREVLEERTPLRESESTQLTVAAGSLRDVISQSRDGAPDAELVARTHELLDDAADGSATFVVQRAVAGLRRCLRIATSWTE